MTFIAREESFICEKCKKSVELLGKGTYRDHCPHCLYSKHVDRDGPGDRLSLCHGLFEPVAIDQDGKKGFVIMYKCQKCSKKHRNRAAPDDNVLEFLKKRAEEL